MSDHGRFIWYELMTPDIAGAKAFYGDVVGWTATKMPGDMEYWVLEADGLGVGGVMLLGEEHKAQGIPPNWTGYVAVDDCDAAAQKATSLGGSVMREPQDIPGIGRFAIVADPTGAVFAIMKPVPPENSRPKPAEGALGHTGWRELYSGPPDTTFLFYAGLFGWTRDEAHDMGPMGVYQLFSNQDGQVGGMMKRPDNVPAACWLYYFKIGDIDAAAGRVKAGGGQVLNGPMETPGGDWVLQGMDPQGAMFCLMGKKG
ncbi:MAG: VOC family protein [Phenylobacterium sp.]|uniref:VOC family protein n=1 Tax=Phenylobacterium sp. TaxID=1871053 RepID=UPI0012176CB3|nr:VOC family protein [Phenylobacterium sp.]TAJ74567.1 MAG: VOC family protein [Phenylobacterium sp.]